MIVISQAAAPPACARLGWKSGRVRFSTTTIAAMPAQPVAHAASRCPSSTALNNATTTLKNTGPSGKLQGEVRRR